MKELEKYKPAKCIHCGWHIWILKTKKAGECFECFMRQCRG
jgi:hypothetical protein